MISIIIPTLNEEKNISSCIESILRQTPEFEIIIVDAGSSDNTVAIAQSKKAVVLRSDKKNIGYQCNLGAKSSNGDILIFLHADTRLCENALERVRYFFKKYRGAAGGSFNMRIEGNSFFYKILSMGGNIFCAITKIHFGDRGIFVRKKVFERISGFQDMPIMEDVDFSQRMKKHGKTKILKGPVVSSSRKFEKEPFYKTLYLVLSSLFYYMVKADLNRIKEKYYGS
ncbi:MAG: TIGR04283 family arsenosugar biosynthesis glycosyltransferase [Actinomycetota bacterium]